MINRLDIDASDFEARLTHLLTWDPGQDLDMGTSVKAIIADVRARGDAALLDYTRRFDRLDCVDAARLRIEPAELHAALQALPPANAPRWKPPRSGSGATTSTRRRSPGPTSRRTAPAWASG